MKNPRLSQITKELRTLRIQYKNAPQSLKDKIKEKGLSLKKEYNEILIKRLGQKKNTMQLSIIEGWEK